MVIEFLIIKCPVLSIYFLSWTCEIGINTPILQLKTNKV